MQGIIASVIVVLVAITFALWGIQNYLHGGGDHDTVAKVNGVKITEKQLHLAYDRVQRQKMLQQGEEFSLDQKAQEDLKKQVLQQLIKNEVVSQAANKMGFVISKQQISGTIAGLPIFQVNGVFSPEKFQQVLANLSYSESDFINELERSLTLTQLETGIASSAIVFPFEIDNAIKLMNQKRDFGYFNIDNERFSNVVVINPNEIQDYYQKHQEDFVTPEKISIEYIQLSADEMKKTVKFSDANLQQFYKKNIARYSVSNKPKSFDAVKNKVQDDYLHQQVLQSFNDQNDKLTDLVYTNSDSLAPAAKTLGLEIKSTDLFTKDGEKNGLLANPKVLKAAFNESVLKQGYNSVPIEISTGNILVLRIKNHIPEAVLPLEKVKATILTNLKSTKMQLAAKALGEKILQEMKTGADPMLIANKYDLAWHVSSNVGRKEKQIYNEILNSAFSLAANDSIGVDVAEKSYAVVKVLKSYDGDKNLVNDAELKSLKEDLETKYGAFEYSLLMDELVKNAKIKIEDSTRSS